jgi:hypothetical protein
VIRIATESDLAVISSILETSDLYTHEILERELVANVQFKLESPGSLGFDSPRVTLKDSRKSDNFKTNLAICSVIASIPFVILSAVDNAPAMTSAVSKFDCMVTSNNGSDCTSFSTKVAAWVLLSKSTSAFSNFSSPFISIVYSLELESIGARAEDKSFVYLFSTDAGEYWTRQGFYEVPVPELVEALPDAPQVHHYRNIGWLPTEIAWRLEVA